MREPPAVSALCERIEALALAGAARDPRPDKSAWIRVWAAARQSRGHPAEAEQWTDAVALWQEEEEERTRWLLRNSGPHSAGTDLDDLFGPGREP